MIKKIFFIILIILGVFLFVYGGYDDSPGAQGLGVLAVIISIVGMIKMRKKTFENKK